MIRSVFGPGAVRCLSGLAVVLLPALALGANAPAATRQAPAQATDHAAKPATPPAEHLDAPEHPAPVTKPTPSAEPAEAATKPAAPHDDHAAPTTKPAALAAHGEAPAKPAVAEGHGEPPGATNAVDAELTRLLEKLPSEQGDPHPGLNSALTNSHDKLVSSNLLPPPIEKSTVWQMLQVKLDLGRQYRREKNLPLAETNLVMVLDSVAPDEMKRTALMELAFVAQDAQKYSRAQQILSQYLKRFPDDPSTPEILLRQGLLYRQMGANVLALAKFYAVMSASLNLKLDRLDYYQRLVLQAQTEIADTYYLQGKYEEAADYLNRLLKLDSPELNKGQILYKLIRAQHYQGRYTDSSAQAAMYLARYAGSPEEPEVRFLFSDALKKLGRTRDAIQQVLVLLQSQEEKSHKNPENWIYWQQRTGNEIANQLYKEGDYVNALEIYLNLSPLDNSPAWQIPVWYQIGLIYERLQQPQKAIETYSRILKREKELAEGGAPSPSLSAVMDMARWRQGQLGWNMKADDLRKNLAPTVPPVKTADASAASKVP